MSSFIIAFWLVMPHLAMRKQRDAVIFPLTEAFERTMQEISSPTQEDGSVLIARTEELTALKKRYEPVMETYPVWLLETRKLIRLLVVLLLPALLAAGVDHLQEIVAFVSNPFQARDSN
jgi:hypothetical protein